MILQSQQMSMSLYLRIVGAYVKTRKHIYTVYAIFNIFIWKGTFLNITVVNYSFWLVVQIAVFDALLECNEMSKEWEHPREPKGWNHMFYHFTVMLSDLKSNPPSIGLAEKPNSAYCTLFYRSGFIGKWQIFAYLFLDIDSFMNYLCSFEASEITSWPFLNKTSIVGWERSPYKRGL